MKVFFCFLISFFSLNVLSQSFRVLKMVDRLASVGSKRSGSKPFEAPKMVISNVPLIFRVYREVCLSQ